ncbi:MAG: DUF882 domain-containing protein [Phenylobacterium sp.]
MHRRQALKSAVGILGVAVGGRAFAATEARSIAFHNLHTGESLSATYWESGRYLPDALDALNHLMRDHRTGEVHQIELGLFDLISALRSRLESSAAVQVISGYRSPATNATLHANSQGVSTRSLHMEGRATDLRIAGVDLPRLRDAAWSLQRGGVGFYPRSQFVHLDVGRVRRWAGA